jgi:hypothetical protein
MGASRPPGAAPRRCRPGGRGPSQGPGRRGRVEGDAPFQEGSPSLSQGHLRLLLVKLRAYHEPAGKTPHRPNGSEDPSPGLRPKADALGKRTPYPCGLKGRENLFRCRRPPQEGLDQMVSQPPQTPGQQSRDLSGRTALSISPPRASACGLSPGLRSPGPLGRTGRPLASWVSLSIKPPTVGALLVSQSSNGGARPARSA